jgi:hypothetical protein
MHPFMAAIVLRAASARANLPASHQPLKSIVHTSFGALASTRGRASMFQVSLGAWRFLMQPRRRKILATVLFAGATLSTVSYVLIPHPGCERRPRVAAIAALVQSLEFRLRGGQNNTWPTSLSGIDRKLLKVQSAPVKRSLAGLLLSFALPSFAAGGGAQVGRGEILIHFPEQWRSFGELQLRRGAPGVLLISREGANEETQAWAVKLGPPAKVRRSIEGEWENSAPIPRRNGGVVNVGRPASPRVRVGERTYETPSGAGIYDAYPSSGGKWIALVSSKEPVPESRGGILFFGGSDRPKRGEVFIDVFEQATGRLAFSTRRTADSPSGTGIWAGADFFLLAVDRGQSLLAVNLAREDSLETLLREPPEVAAIPFTPRPAALPGHDTALTPRKHLEVPPYARLTGVRDSAVEDPNTGYLREVLLQVEMEVRAPGRYMVQASLRARDGSTADGGAHAKLEAGAQRMLVRVSAATLRADGPYTVQLVLRNNDDWARPVVDLRDAGATLPYRAAQIAQGELYLTGRNLVAGRDLDGDGKFDWLVMQREVYVANPGLYQWQTNLADATDHKLGVYIGAGQLQAGLNWLYFAFDGRSIMSDGPYHVAIFAMGGMKLPSLSKGPLVTEAFRASAFAGGRPIAQTLTSPLSFSGGISSGRFETPFSVSRIVFPGTRDKVTGAPPIAITVELAAGPARARLVGKTTATTDGPGARFDVHPDRPGDGYVLRASGPGLVPIETAPFSYRP